MFLTEVGDCRAHERLVGLRLLFSDGGSLHDPLLGLADLFCDETLVARRLEASFALLSFLRAPKDDLIQLGLYSKTRCVVFALAVAHTILGPVELSDQGV